MQSHFVLAMCQPGAAQALIDESGLARAFGKGGLLTLKSPALLGLDDVPAPVFARYTGLSLGKADGIDAAKKLAGRAVDVIQVAGKRSRAPNDGDVVLTVVDGWAGLHKHRAGRTSPYPAGVIDVDVPDEAPSRAWLKLEEAIRTFALPFTAGQTAVDLGAAPGGATWNLLQRGLTVVAIDPNAMKLQHERLTHHKTTSMSATPRDADWVLLDVNVPPGTALRGALPHIDKARVGCVLTLKMKDWTLAAEVPGWLKRLRGFDVVARQLSSNGQEICVVGLRR